MSTFTTFLDWRHMIDLHREIRTGVYILSFSTCLHSLFNCCIHRKQSRPLLANFSSRTSNCISCTRSIRSQYPVKCTEILTHIEIKMFYYLVLSAFNRSRYPRSYTNVNTEILLVRAFCLLLSFPLHSG